MWHNTGMKTNLIKKLKSHQKYNHFPGTYQLAKKTCLGRNLMKMHRLFPDDYKFFPKTWVLPNDFPDFVKHAKHHEGQTYIVKPDNLSQGNGIYLTKNKDDINPRTNNVIQEYMEDPFLVDNLKFDIRLYVYVTSVEPLRIYLFDDGLVRFATEEYQKPTEENIDNTYIHLTNYAINKNHKNFIFNEKGSDKGHKRSLKSFWESLSEQGIQTDIIMDEIKDIIIKTFLAVQPQLAHEYRSCLSEDIDGSM
jgi:tubulin polyglutamylase TTLL6/13